MEKNTPEPSKPKPAMPQATASKWLLPKLPVLIGVAGLGAVVTTGSWFKRQSDVRQRAEIHAIQAEVSGLKKDAMHFFDRMENLRWNAAKMRAEAEASTEEPLKSWLQERSRKFEELVAHIDRVGRQPKFAGRAEQIEEFCRRGEIAKARDETMQLRPPKFPSPAEFRQLQEEIYSQPLANFSRRNPTYYRALQTYEPDSAKEDISALRAELAQTDLDAITPQSLVTFELLSAVAPANDPMLADLAAVASAADYFDNPDRETIKRWREAKRAMRLEDWQAAYARMQSITLSTVRTRQPFRAAYGRAILKNRPDEKQMAYNYLQEAAAAGDAEARRWVAQEDLVQGRHAEALRWLETGVVDGDLTLVPQLLSIYAMDRGPSRDLGREAGMLQRITVAPDAPPLAWMLLGRHYEEGGGVAASAEKAFACYLKAANQQLAPAWLEAARCYLCGIGTALNLEEARNWAVKSYASGERAKSVPMLVELMQRAPDRTAGAVQELLDREQIASPAGFQDLRIAGPSVAKLRMQLARFLEQKGSFAAAARLYAQSGNGDAAAAHRHAELTAVQVCDVCGGIGKTQTLTPCPVCVGKGTVTCGTCDGWGFSFIPGSPPCTTCGGSGGVVQDGRTASCSACGGTGKGKGSVIKQICVQCSHGRSPCRECDGGWIKLVKECAQCRGVGSRALVDP